MTPLEFLILLLIAGTCGAIGELIGVYTPGGSLKSAVLGFLGALLGKWLAEQFNLPEIFRLMIGSFQFPLLWSILSSILFVLALSLYQRLKAQGHFRLRHRFLLH